MANRLKMAVTESIYALLQRGSSQSWIARTLQTTFMLPIPIPIPMYIGIGTMEEGSLKATGLEVGRLINFGAESLEYQRFIPSSSAQSAKSADQEVNPQITQISQA